jgi:endonuclease/exonuclease/phosphatase (EEP) superfamily protein YafD
VVGLLLASLLLALVRVADPTARRLIELVTLSPLGLPSAALALLGAAAWATTSRGRVAGVLAATCLVGVHAWWLAPLYVGAHPAGRSGSLVVLAQNLEYGDDAAFTDLVRSRGVDVLVLTDIGTERIDRLLGAGLQAWLPYSAGVRNHRVHGGAVVLSRFPVTRTAFLYDDAESRVVDIRAPGLGPVTFVALHARPPYAPDVWRADYEQIHAALTRIRADADSAVVLAGDFNATLAHAPVRRILDLGFTDSAAQVNGGWSPTWPSGGHERRFGIPVPTFAAIDHVMTSPRLVVTDAETIEVPGADHKAVLATISTAGTDRHRVAATWSGGLRPSDPRGYAPCRGRPCASAR